VVGWPVQVPVEAEVVVAEEGVPALVVGWPVQVPVEAEVVVVVSFQLSVWMVASVLQLEVQA
jgi:hypothetical protein